MTYTVGEYEYNSGKIKYITYRIDADQKINPKIRPLIERMFRLSNMDNLKVFFLYKIIPSSGKFPIDVLNDHVAKYGNNETIILMNQRIANPYFDAFTLDVQKLFKQECMNLGFYNVIWNNCMRDFSTDWLMYGNEYTNSWLSTRVGMGDGKLVNRYFVKDKTTDSIITKTE